MDFSFFFYNINQGSKTSIYICCMYHRCIGCGNDIGYCSEDLCENEYSEEDLLVLYRVRAGRGWSILWCSTGGWLPFSDIQEPWAEGSCWYSNNCWRSRASRRNCRTSRRLASFCLTLENWRIKQVIRTRPTRTEIVTGPSAEVGILLCP